MSPTAKNNLAIAISVSIGGLLAWLADSGSHSLAGWPLLPALALLAFAIQWLAFIPAYISQTEHYYDVTGSLTYCSLIVLALLAGQAHQWEPRALLLAGLVVLWFLRLGSFLFLRVRKDGKDSRFDTIKPVFSAFLLVWSLQGLWVFLTLLAALIAITSTSQPPLGAWALLGGLMWLIGFAMETIADAQKTAFKKDPANAGRFIQSGLWAWSRHPNYFGEILLWSGIAMIALPCFSGWQWLGLLSPVFVAVLIVGISGVPLLEQRADAKWGKDVDYQQYKASTPILLPWPR